MSQKLVATPNWFSSLSPEIRNTTYELLLREEKEIVLNSYIGFINGRNRTIFRPVPDFKSLSLVNRAISQEAHSIYFFINHFRVQNNPLHLERALELFRFIPRVQVKDLKHLTINIFFVLVTHNPNIAHIPWHQLGELAFCWDVSENQLRNLRDLITYIVDSFKILRVLTVEIAKNSFVPYARYSHGGNLGKRSVSLALALAEVFTMSCLESVILVEKQDAEVDFFWRTLNKPRVWTGDVQVRRG